VTAIFKNSIWQTTLSLKDRILENTSGLDLPYTDHWSILVILSLNQANRRLHSIAKLLEDDDCDGAIILTRSLFELAANISYISRNEAKYLPEYLRHGGVPLTKEEIQQLRQEIESIDQLTAIERIPGTAWKPMKQLCKDLGWLKEYLTFYRFASIPSHSGSFTLGSSFLKLRNGCSSTENDRVGILATALAFHLRIAKIAASKFPHEISNETLGNLHIECNEIGQYIATHK